MHIPSTVENSDGQRADRGERPDRWRRLNNGLDTVLVQYGPYRADWGWHIWRHGLETLRGVPKSN